jgi:transposase
VTEVVEAVLRRKHAALHFAAKGVANSVQSPADDACVDAVLAPSPHPATKEQQARQARRQRRQARYREVMALHEGGRSQRQIATALEIGRHTVRRFRRAGGFPERVPSAPRASVLRRYEPYLRERWAQGCDTALQLWRELRVQGDAGCAPPAIRTYSPRQTTWRLLREPQALTEQERAYVVHLAESCPEVALVPTLACSFRALVRDHDVAALASWLEQADQRTLPEVRGFADGLRADRAAVEASLTLPWSQGQTEGQVNRLKTLKRAMYGRARFDLLRVRLLHAA